VQGYRFIYNIWFAQQDTFRVSKYSHPHCDCGRGSTLAATGWACSTLTDPIAVLKGFAPQQRRKGRVDRAGAKKREERAGEERTNGKGGTGNGGGRHCLLLQEFLRASTETWYMTGTTNQKNWLTFGGDLVPDTDSESPVHFPQHCGIGVLGDLLAFFTQSLTSRFVQKMAKWPMSTRYWIHYIAGAIQHLDIRIQIRISSEIRIRILITFDWDFGFGGGLHSLGTI